MYQVDCFDSSTVQLVSQCKLPTKQLHDLKWPALGLTALMCVCVCVCVCVVWGNIDEASHLAKVCA